MKRYLHAKVAGLTALLAGALALLAATAAPALAKGYALVPSHHASTNSGALLVVAVVSLLSVALLGVTVVGARRQLRSAQMVASHTARFARTRLTRDDKPSSQRRAA